jgi:hypothetical protein
MTPCPHRFATSGFRRFKIPDLHRFATSRLRGFKIPDIHRFATSGLRGFKIIYLLRVNYPENSFHEFRQTRRFEGDRFFLNPPTRNPHSAMEAFEQKPALVTGSHETANTITPSCSRASYVAQQDTAPARRLSALRHHDERCNITQIHMAARHICCGQLEECTIALILFAGSMLLKTFLECRLQRSTFRHEWHRTETFKTILNAYHAHCPYAYGEAYALATGTVVFFWRSRVLCIPTHLAFCFLLCGSYFIGYLLTAHCT